MKLVLTLWKPPPNSIRLTPLDPPALVALGDIKSREPCAKTPARSDGCLYEVDHNAILNPPSMKCCI